MKFGICNSIDKSREIADAGWDFVEENVQGLLQGNQPDAQWAGMDRVRQSALPVLAANCLVPGAMKITGPSVDLAALKSYMTNVLKRARQAGMINLVFGSGGARAVPEGFDRDKARQQIIEFGRLVSPTAGEYGVTLVLEPLCRKECNIINTVAEAMTYVKAVDHPNFQCLVDSYHFWTDDEPLDNLVPAMPWIKHVHLADKVGRVAPGESGVADYRPFFKVLKAGGYDGPISVEAAKFNDIEVLGPKVLKFLKEQWAQA